MLPFFDLLDPKTLASSIWGDVALPDARLHARLRTTTAMLVERLEAPTCTVPRKVVVGAQRLWNNDRVTPESLSTPMLDHQAGLLVEATSLLIAHDTMEIDLTGRYQTDDAGPLRSSHACGHLLHWSLAVDPITHRPLAALAYTVWTRPMETRKQDHASRPPEQRESIKWAREITACLETLARSKVDAQITHVIDREGDTHDNFTFAVRGNHRVITRAARDHAIAEAPGTLFRRFADDATFPQEATCIRRVPTKARADAMREARAAGRDQVRAVTQALKDLGGQRDATLRVRWTEVTLAPDARKKKSSKRAPVRVWGVQIEERDAPLLVEPLSWLLLTTVPVATLEEALAVVDMYRGRWPIEPMHAVLKTGLQVEQAGVHDVTASKRLLSVLLPVSLHLMRWAYGWRENPQELARAQVPTAVITALKSACRFRGLTLPRREWTIKDAVLRLAALGGYEHRPDRTPGWLVLWRGWRELLRFWRVVAFAQTAASTELPDEPPPKMPWKPRGA